MTSIGRNQRSVPSTAADIMRTPVVTVSPSASLRELLSLFRRAGISGVPVVGMDQQAIGTVSVTDLLWRSDWLAEEGADGDPSRVTGHLDEATVQDIMTPDVFGVGPDASLAQVAAFFARTGLGRAVVLDMGRPVGIVSVIDLLAQLADRATDSGPS